ncbi:MAG: polysaccharide deacetylase family protein [Alphaproteobacteria bacterium]|nr:polysaccharide deacetylase family protein [Alphaproteobacteria bacterium]
MNEALKKIAKKAAYFGGVLPMQHVVEHRDTLTAVMFHRVLDRDDPRWHEANPRDTVSTDFFADCLRFFRRHYDVVSLGDVVRATADGARLPTRGLLITFDDGWSDNLRYAAPALRARGLPAVVFVTVDAVASPDAAWWQERIYAAYRTGAMTPQRHAALDAAIGAAVQPGAWVERPDEPPVLSLIARLSTLDAARRASLIADLPPREQGTRMMLTPAELAALGQAGIELGVHGFSHAPLTMLADPGDDLARARDGLRGMAGGIACLDALAYPHGRYDERVQAAAERLGYTAIFTSDEHINRLQPGGVPNARAIGRIVIDQQLLADARGRLKREEMATWLFRRPLR